MNAPYRQLAVLGIFVISSQSPLTGDPIRFPHARRNRRRERVGTHHQLDAIGETGVVEQCPEQHPRRSRPSRSAADCLAWQPSSLASRSRGIGILMSKMLLDGFSGSGLVPSSEAACRGGVAASANVSNRESNRRSQGTCLSPVHRPVCRPAIAWFEASRAIHKTPARAVARRSTACRG
jgi:hypothetical protein